ncbi:hypothetical protein SDC9_115061 [bioreactor metagenome]|uniref:Type I restriction modification DNA specificity domain-containing protein n=1 Tax=bioreactor metagenome TaxID=1076179 RepID=A0A645BRS2_9ZZZZ
MQKLLDPNSGVRLPGFEGSKWTKSTIGTLFEIGSSLSVPREQLSDDGIPYLHYGDVHSNRTGIVDIEKDGIPKLRTENVQEKFFLDDGDVVFVDASEDYDGVSKYVVIRNDKGHPFLAGLHTLPAHSKTGALSFGFKRYCFMSSKIKKQFAFYASGMKVLGLNKASLSKIEIEYPSLKEQTAIASILSAADCEIDLLEQELEAWQQKRKALMQLLLTGLVRV